MLQLEKECYSIIELETSWEKETCIHVELGDFIFFRIVVYINRLFVINDRYNSSFNYLLLHFAQYIIIVLCSYRDSSLQSLCALIPLPLKSNLKTIFDTNLNY